MVVDIYDPAKFFGFCASRDLSERVFFHVSVFIKMSPDDKAPPIPGEIVEIQVQEPEAALEPSDNRRPKATLVRRLVAPNEILGRVRSFDSRTGWGFIEDTQGRVCFLHRADILIGQIPIIGDDVVFYEGIGKGGRKRACAVRSPE